MDYILKSSRMFFGLSTRDIRDLAFGFGRKMEISMPQSWFEKHTAGIDWFTGFMKRHPNLSLRKPQASSLARAMCFNRPSVEAFYRNLAAILDETKVTPHNIWNMDESGFSTVHHPERVVAERGVRQVARIVSGDRGTMVTLALAVSAGGVALPPFYIFPRVRLPSHFMKGATTGSIGIANKSGWQTGETYFIFLQHFQRFVKSSKEAPTVLVLDNHESH